MKVEKHRALFTLVTAVLCLTGLRAQSPTVLAFETASVKPNMSGSPSGRDAVQPGGRYVATNLSLAVLIRMAHEPSPTNMGLSLFEHEGGPEWLPHERFDVDARAGREVTIAELRQMLQALLAERFQLRVHRETRQRSVYRMTLVRTGRLGRGLRRSAIDCAREPADPLRGVTPGETYPCGYFGPSPAVDVATGKANQAFRGLTLASFGRWIQQYLGRPVLDATGLAGYYDGDFEYTAEIVMPPPPPGTPNPYDGRVLPSVFSVLPEQLGLRLESTRGPADVLVIDRAERLTAN